jgi:hypothetical protein
MGFDFLSIGGIGISFVLVQLKLALIVLHNPLHYCQSFYRCYFVQ